jgi:putative transposase
MIVSDNGTEFTSTAILAWAEECRIAWHYIAPGKPTQNGFVESFNGRMRDELLNESLFFTLDHARQKLAAWAEDYNTRRPHSSIGYQTPAAYAAHLNATGRPATQFESSADRPVAHPAPIGVTKPEALVRAG